MKSNPKFTLLFFMLIFLFSIKTFSKKSEPPLTRILFVFDASQSMQGKWQSDLKINIARKLLYEMIDSLDQLPNIELALRVYGHQSYVPPQDCNDTKLEVPFNKKNGEKIKHVLKYLKPKGTTPIAKSLEMSQYDFTVCDNCRNIIILITDGIEACEGDPCEVSKKLQKQGILLKPFIIGIGFDPGLKESFKCVGDYFNATNEEEFKEVLNIVITKTLNQSTAQVNLLDSLGNPTETNVNMTFYDHLSGKIKYNIIHTMNNRGNPDTLILDPLITYGIKIHTIPPRFIDSAVLTPGKHSVFFANTPQGFIKLNTKEIKYKDLKILIKEYDNQETLLYTSFDKTEKLITGKYDIEIPTLPIIKLKNIEINQSQTTAIEIPRPGIVTLLFSSAGVGSIYKIKDNDQEWVCNISENNDRETFLLLPGDYKAVFRPKNAGNSYFTATKVFNVKQGTALAVSF
ncbi:MAG: VWA domain-containing protein [Bacteroidales bacterium]|nr:VWA domain-containing protein [Bacteroidales bacterium]